MGVVKGSTKIYATIDLKKAHVGRTCMISNEPIDPHWYESFHIYCSHMAADVIFIVKIDNPIGASLIGTAYFPIMDLLDGEEIDKWLEICDENREPIGDSKIHVKLQILLANGKNYEPHRCWEDIFDAISKARHLIYITGWSVCTEITLVRDTNRPKPGGDVTLGELLKRKASEGVRVLMLVWDDRTLVGLLKKDGLMATHDEETTNYFHGMDVNYVLCPRNLDDSGSFVQDLQISTMFTHHQKIVVVDHELPNQSSQQRRIVSFIGGIDLCDGRYDTQYHSLFRTLDTIHHDDFHQPNFEGGSIKKGGPREPWHDIHSRWKGQLLGMFFTTLSRDGGSRCSLDPLMVVFAFGFPETPRKLQELGFNPWWQRRTMEMMYTDITQALQAKGIEANPKEYLTFFCLGNHEVKQEGEYELEEHLEPDTDYIRAQEARRFMIYVHTKMMIVKLTDIEHIFYTVTPRAYFL
ncbi:unnamed protein product [Miscanthus lutarioriparius]|uniref:Phospholipase D alpha 1 n=1 Tax=Miscanthus lutarioriparius TaxID=422564 RepID=A0A811P9E4_9POAL|nr:unnamed protein product [Miscanthus lutarioriparius]